jgi:hypothetical protein
MAEANPRIGGAKGPARARARLLDAMWRVFDLVGGGGGGGVYELSGRGRDLYERTKHLPEGEREAEVKRHFRLRA